MKQVVKKMLVIPLSLVFMMCLSSPYNVQAKTLSTKENEKYASVLEKESYLDDSTLISPGSSSFTLYDVNNDGRKDLIIQGYLGLRSASEYCIYTYDGKEFHRSYGNGDILGVYKNYILADYYDYSDAGEHTYDEYYVSKVNSKGKINTVLWKYTENKYDKNTKDMKTVSFKCKKISGKSETKITKNQFNILDLL